MDQLVAFGHEVTVFGVGRRCGTAGRFVSVLDEPQHPRLGEAMPAALHAARVADALCEPGFDGAFDVVHDHSLCGPLAAHCIKPVLPGNVLVGSQPVAEARRVCGDAHDKAD